MSYGCRLEREKRERQLRLEDSLYDPALVVQKPKSIATTGDQWALAVDLNSIKECKGREDMSARQWSRVTGRQMHGNGSEDSGRWTVAAEVCGVELACFAWGWRLAREACGLGGCMLTNWNLLPRRGCFRPYLRLCVQSTDDRPQSSDLLAAEVSLHALLARHHAAQAEATASHNHGFRFKDKGCESDWMRHQIGAESDGLRLTRITSHESSWNHYLVAGRTPHW